MDCWIYGRYKTVTFDFFNPLNIDKDEKKISVVLIHMLLVHYNALGNCYEPHPHPQMVH